MKHKKNEPEPVIFAKCRSQPKAHLCRQKNMTCWGVKCIGESDSAGNGNVPCHFRSLAARQHVMPQAHLCRQQKK